ncbi:MAG: isochorismatase family protein [Corynebacterium sp.]|uniref:isochorismatase family protein n=1 Tax=Corynebacterium sp. TaxID=1720 RepID=UPI0017CB469E|nr:isochorismatase family protein [Corynebacterium sp.]NWO17057.1 isochorismatase family protein [Corynebacterium sp.]
MSEIRRALIVIDVQNDYFDGPLAIQYPPRDEALSTIVQVIDAAQQEGLPVAFVQHAMDDSAPVFNPTTDGYALHKDIASRQTNGTHHVIKRFGSIYADTDVEQWLRENNADTVTLVGFMTNNCVIASAVEGEQRGLVTEVLSDATGAINLSNAAGTADAQTVHETLMTLLNSNFAAVGTSEQWKEAVNKDTAIDRSNLIESAIQGLKNASR